MSKNVILNRMFKLIYIFFVLSLVAIYVLKLAEII